MRSMFGISSVIKNDKTSVFNEDTSPRQRLVDQWPAIYSWSIYIFDNFIEGLPRGDSNRAFASKGLILALHQLSHVQPVWEQMVESRQMVEIATRLWLEEDTDMVYCGACLLQSILPDKASSESVSCVIRTALPQDLTAITKLCVDRLRFSLESPNLGFEAISVYLKLMFRLSLPQDIPVRATFIVTHKATKIATEALVKLTTCIDSYSVPFPDNFEEAIDDALSFIRLSIYCTNGFSWVRQSINAGLLSAIHECIPHLARLHPQITRRVKQFLTEVLPPYLVYRAVLEATKKPLIKTEKSPWKEQIATSQVASEWKAYVKLARTRIQMAEDLAVDSPRRLVCDNIHVCDHLTPGLYILTGSPI